MRAIGDKLLKMPLEIAHILFYTEHIKIFIGGNYEAYISELD